MQTKSRALASKFPADMVKQGLVNLDGTYITYPYILIHFIYGFAIADPLEIKTTVAENLGLL